jgi:lysine 2,3-aminomutase
MALLLVQALDAALVYIADHPEIWEVILTGGDPLVLSPRRLKQIMQALGDIEHLKVVRFHTRVPVVDPARIDAEMIGALKSSSKTVYVALHANHPRELTEEARGGLRCVDRQWPHDGQPIGAAQGRQ